METTELKDKNQVFGFSGQNYGCQHANVKYITPYMCGDALNRKRKVPCITNYASGRIDDGNMYMFSPITNVACLQPTRPACEVKSFRWTFMISHSQNRR
jgi:hypothetical protein